MKQMIPDIDTYIPYDKSWMIRMGFLDMINGYSTINELLDREDETALGTDLIALNRTTKQWHNDEKIDVGESGTLYRLLQFAAWHTNSDKDFVKRGTLKNRAITNSSEIVSWPLSKLLTLDNGTSQWASASILLGTNEPKPEPLPFKLSVTYEARDHWAERRLDNRNWDTRLDETIKKQTLAYIGWLATGSMNFEPEQAEDYCFARAFGIISPEEGELKWPSLRQHESDRITEMERALGQDTVTSADHRVVQAVAMLKGNRVSFSKPESVAKSWPLFWRMLDRIT